MVIFCGCYLGCSAFVEMSEAPEPYAEAILVFPGAPAFPTFNQSQCCLAKFSILIAWICRIAGTTPESQKNLNGLSFRFEVFLIEPCKVLCS